MTELRETDDEKILQFPTPEGQEPPAPSEDFLRTHARGQYILRFFIDLDAQKSPTLQEQFANWKKIEIQNLDTRRAVGRDVVVGEDSISEENIEFHEGIINSLALTDLLDYANEEIAKQEEAEKSSQTDDAKGISTSAIQMWQERREKIENAIKEEQTKVVT